MTPLVKEMVKWYSKVGFDPTEAQWFDLSNAIHYDIDVTHWLKNGRTPFNQCFVLGKVKDGYEFCLIVVGDSLADGVVVSGHKIFHDHHEPINRITFYESEQGQVHAGASELDEPVSEQDRNVVAHLLGMFFESVSQKSIAYMPVPHKANVSRKKRGLHLLYDFKTVFIEPVKPRSEYRGGTHASPRWHERRGHFRRTKNGQVWVKNCEVGDKTKGAVFHDYAFKEKETT